MRKAFMRVLHYIILRSNILDIEVNYIYLSYWFSHLLLSHSVDFVLWAQIKFLIQQLDLQRAIY